MTELWPPAGVSSHHLDETKSMEHLQPFLNPDASHDTAVDEEHGDIVIFTYRAERASRPTPVFFRACQGHSCFAHSIERTCMPCEFGMARCHGHLLRVTPLETMKESTSGSGAITHPNKLSGLRKAPDFGPLGLIPTRREFPAPLAKVYQAAGAAPAGGGPPTQGTWLRAVTPSFWEADATHDGNWQYVVVFNGRVVTRLRHRTCRDGILLTTGQARFSGISRIAQLTLVEQNARNAQQLIWNMIFSQEWSAFK
eukprot:8560654-Pyramimonas_sp.AAC.1